MAKKFSAEFFITKSQGKTKLVLSTDKRAQRAQFTTRKTQQLLTKIAKLGTTYNISLTLETVNEKQMGEPLLNVHGILTWSVSHISSYSQGRYVKCIGWQNANF